METHLYKETKVIKILNSFSLGIDFFKVMWETRSGAEILNE